MIAATYVVNLIGPDEALADMRGRWLLSEELLRELEENVSDLLPEGWTVQISEWDDEGTEDLEDG